MVWRLFHNKIPTDDVLAARGFHFPSMCNLCNNNAEAALHLFLQCPSSLILWHWLSSIIKMSIDLTSRKSQTRAGTLNVRSSLLQL
jgi:hypothetical protein